MAKLLLKYNADPNALTEYNWTPLHSACKWNNTKCVALLLQHGADVNAISNGSMSYQYLQKYIYIILIIFFRTNSFTHCCNSIKVSRYSNDVTNDR